MQRVDPRRNKIIVVHPVRIRKMPPLPTFSVSLVDTGEKSHYTAAGGKTYEGRMVR